MRTPSRAAGESDGRALYLIGLTILFVTFLVALSAILGRAPKRVSADDGGGGMVHLIPGAPSPIDPVGTFPDGPAYTIVEDTREFLRRLPDRNTPVGWSNPTVKPKPK